MKRTYTWEARPVGRNWTVADMHAAKGSQVPTQVTANTTEEAETSGTAGIDLMICNTANVEKVRAGNDRLFLTGALQLHAYATPDDVLREAWRAMSAGADAITTPRSLSVVEMLAKEDIPSLGHLGLVPRKSTWVGGLRTGGTTADEAYELFQ